MGGDLEMKGRCLELMRQAEVVYLSTIDGDGFPQTRALFNLRNAKQFPLLAPLFAEHDDDLLVYLGTNTSSAKHSEALANPNACVYFCQASRFESLMMTGRLELITDQDTKRQLWQDGWERYYPSGPEDPDYSVLALRPLKAKGWWHGQAFALDLTADG